MRRIALLLCVSLVVSLLYGPLAVAAEAEESEPKIGDVIIGLGLAYLLIKGIIYLIQGPERAEAAQLDKIDAYIADHPNLSPAIAQAMRARRPALGMTAEQAYLALGAPIDINRSVGAWGVSEQWVYNRPRGERMYVYFENGIVTSWQE